MRKKENNNKNEAISSILSFKQKIPRNHHGNKSPVLNGFISLVILSFCPYPCIYIHLPAFIQRTHFDPFSVTDTVQGGQFLPLKEFTYAEEGDEHVGGLKSEVA